MIPADYFKIAIQKSGRITDESLHLLKKAGLKFTRKDRQLYGLCQQEDIAIIFARNSDIPTLIFNGAAHIGICGEDVIMESGYKIRELLDLDSGRCTLDVAVHEDAKIDNISELNGKKIATSFPRLTKKYFNQKKVAVEVIEMHGGVELAPSLRISDAITDIVATGTTLQANNLVSIHTMYSFSMKLIAASKLDGAQENLMAKITNRIQSVLAADAHKLVVMNAPRKNLADIIEALPGMKSPTLSELSNKEWVSIQSVIPTNNLWQNLEELKSKGAEDILVMDLDQVLV